MNNIQVLHSILEKQTELMNWVTDNSVGIEESDFDSITQSQVKAYLTVKKIFDKEEKKLKRTVRQRLIISTISKVDNFGYDAPPTDDQIWDNVNELLWNGEYDLGEAGEGSEFFNWYAESLIDWDAKAKYKRFLTDVRKGLKQ